MPLDAITPHQPPPEDAAALLALPKGQLVPPECWHPFGPVDLALWAGPNLAVALRHPRKGWRLHSVTEARALLLDHAFRVPAGAELAVSRTVQIVPLGTPIAEARAAFHRALPQYRVIDLPDSSTVLFLRYPEAILQLTAGKYGELEFVQWVKGERALATLIKHGERTRCQRPKDVLIVPIAPAQGKTLSRVGLLAIAILLAGLVLAAPLLLVDAVLWLVGMGLVWTIGIAMAPGLLERWNASCPSRQVRIDPWRMWLPSGLGPAMVDRDGLTVGVFWRKAFGASSTARASVRNPDATVMQLNAPDLRLSLACLERPPEHLALETVPNDGETRAHSDVTRDAFWRIVSALDPERRRNREDAAPRPNPAKNGE